MANNKPVAQLRLGRIAVAIWEQPTEKGSFYNVTCSRLYKDGNDWKRSDSFGRDDLLVLAKLANQAHSKIFELQADGDADEPSEQ